MIRFNPAREVTCRAVVGLLDRSSTGHCGIYTADASVITYLRLSNPAFTYTTDGTAVANTIYDATSFFDATASYFRMLDGDSTMIWGGTISRLDGTGDMKLDSIVMPKDTTVSISSAIYEVPA